MNSYQNDLPQRASSQISSSGQREQLDPSWYRFSIPKKNFLEIGRYADGQSGTRHFVPNANRKVSMGGKVGLHGTGMRAAWLSESGRWQCPRVGQICRI